MNPHTFQKLFEPRVDPAVLEPELIALQNKALDRLREDRRFGSPEVIEDSFSVAMELDALRLVA